jgi:hypothetical protein
MKALLIATSLIFGLSAAATGHAQAPTGAPAGTTGLCKDGSYYSGDSRKGACRGHKGVKEWYAGNAAAAPAANDAAASPATKKSRKSKKDAAAAPAAAPTAASAVAPAGATGLCKDGTYYSGDTKKGACRGHKGVKDWYGPAAGAAAPARTGTPMPATPAPASPATAAMPTAPAASATAGATGLCKDGTYYSGDTKKGACRGHKGVKDWYGPAAGAAAAPARTGAPLPTSPAAAPAMPAAPTAAPPMAAAPKAPAPMPATPAAGGGNGQVWVNTETKVYHCQNDRYYGKTKQGEYMSEADAIAKGDHASHGKACTQ